MRTVAVKTNAEGHVSACHPRARPGYTKDGGCIHHVTDCPADAPLAEVILLFSKTMIWRPGRYDVAFAELAPGRIVRD